MVDITHQLTNYSIIEAAYVLGTSFSSFPEGTIHFIGLDSGGINAVGKETNYVVAKFQGHLFIGADSGVFSMIFQEKEFSCWKLPIKSNGSTKEIAAELSNAISQLLDGVSPEKLGEEFSYINASHFPRPAADSSGIRCYVIYIDSFGNAVINVSRNLFEKSRDGRPFTIIARRSKISKISSSYHQVEEGDFLALFNQHDLLELALNKDDASKLIGLKILDSILIEFHDR
jgi:S-adenosylmethionine hydrolase